MGEPTSRWSARALRRQMDDAFITTVGAKVCKKLRQPSAEMAHVIWNYFLEGFFDLKIYTN